MVGGVVEGSGDKTEAIEDLVKQARRQSLAPPQIVVASPGRIAVGSGRNPHGGAEVWLVRYNPGEQVTEVKEGDNRGASVTERHVVRQFDRLGSWSGTSKTYSLPPALEDGLVTTIIVQRKNGGPVIAVETPRLPR